MGFLPEYSHFLLITQNHALDEEREPAGKGSVLKDIAWVQQDNMHLERGRGLSELSSMLHW